MTEENPDSWLLKSLRAAPEELERQRKLLKGLALFCRLLDAMQDLVLVLNRQRQTVFANQAFLDFIKRRGSGDAFGKRVGELLFCQNAGRTPNGCGTTEACVNCGSAKAIAAALDGAGAGEPQEFRVQAMVAGEDLNLRVSVTPLRIQDEEFLVFSAVDVTGDNRRRALEAVFFHDVLNTAGGIRAMAELVKDLGAQQAPEFMPRIEAATGMLIEQIASQRDLVSAEGGELPVRVVEVSALGLLREFGLFRAHPVGQGKEVVVADDCEDFVLRTDATLLRRVLGNLVKNALEAEAEGACVTVGCRRSGERAVFTVHNSTPMPRAIQLQVFQKSFSTKGPGRGLGTYSVRLLSERYLKGRVSFAVDEGGTRFTAEYPLRLS